MRHVPAALALGALLGLSACAADRSTASDLPDDVDLHVVMEDVRYVPERITVPAGDGVTVLLENDGGIVHDLVFDGWDSGEIRPGATAVVELGPLEESVTAWCSVPGHRDAGMELEIVVERV